jgi:hypothetical protein
MPNFSYYLHSKITKIILLLRKIKHDIEVPLPMYEGTALLLYKGVILSAALMCSLVEIARATADDTDIVGRE